MPKYPGDLRSWLENYAHTRVPAEPRRKILLGLLRAVARVHEFKFTHNDIKLENILLTDQNDAVLCDFELLREESIASSGSTMSTTTLIGGTPAYMPPERIGAHGITGKPHWSADMFAVGVVMLLCFFPDRITDITRKDNATNAMLVRAQVEGQLDERIKDITSRLLDANRDKRPTARSLLPEGAVGGEEAENYFSRASSEMPTYWLPGDAMLNPVSEDIMAALKRAIAPRQQDEFGKGFDCGKEWDTVVRYSNIYSFVILFKYYDAHLICSELAAVPRMRVLPCTYHRLLLPESCVGMHTGLLRAGITRRQPVYTDRKGLARSEPEGMEDVCCGTRTGSGRYVQGPAN